MTRLASFCSGVLEVVNAVAVRLEDVIGEWVDGLATRPPRSRETDVSEAVNAIESYVAASVYGHKLEPYRAGLYAAVANLVGGRS